MIGVFDSGVGGLSVWREIVRCLPDAPTAYLADQAHVPYGARPIDEVRALTLRCVRWLVAQGCDTVVVACNTASGAALEAARAAFPTTPIVGMEPAVKPAALNTQTGVVGVLATFTTFKSPRYADLIRKWSNGVRVIEQPCAGWVEAVEEIENGEIENSRLEIKDSHVSTISNLQSLVSFHVEPLLAQQADTLVLGCTHFPFLRPQIDWVVADWRSRHPGAPPVTVIDPAPAVAQQTQRVYGSRARAVTSSATAPHRFYTTGAPAAFARTATHLLGRLITAEAAE